MLRHDASKRFLIMLCPNAMGIDGNAPKLHHHLVGIHGNARVADGADDTTPIWILAEEGGLYQRGFRHAHGNGLPVGKGLRSRDMNREELGSPLSVSSNALGQFLAHIEEGCAEFLIVCILFRELFVACRSIGQHDHHIVRAHVAIHGNHVERYLCDSGQSLLQEGAVNGRIRRDEAEHGRHVRLYHA